jgi:hypothetical protein
LISNNVSPKLNAPAVAMTVVVNVAMTVVPVTTNVVPPLSTSTINLLSPLLVVTKLE